MIKSYLPWIIALLYVISPYDAIPDFVFGPGWLDDIAVLGVLFWWLAKMKRTAQSTARSSSTARESKKESAGSTKPEYTDPYEILNLEPGASRDEIKAAYKKLAAQYHPDKVQHLGVDFQKLAHEKFVAIQKAYDELIKKTR
jgi:uncharacterized membrane protein YkvA (DUF1232 family)